MFKYREHRKYLAESMANVQKLATKADLISYCQHSLDKYSPGKYDCSKLTIEKYGVDIRTGWNTHIVYLQGCGVLGFTDGPVD